MFPGVPTGSAIGEELAGQYEEARRGYLALEQHFSELGDSDSVSYSYRYTEFFADAHSNSKSNRLSPIHDNRGHL
jgi:hypothetical protein